MKVYIFFPINSFPVVSNLVSEKKKLRLERKKKQRKMEKETEKVGKKQLQRKKET